MVATVYPDSSPLALALPQVGHAALAAVQVTPGLGTRMGMPNRTTAGRWGNGRFLSGPEVGPGPDCCSGAPGLGNVPTQRGPAPVQGEPVPVQGDLGKATGSVSLLFFTLGRSRLQVGLVVLAAFRLPAWGTCPRSRGPVGNAYHTVSRPQVGPVVLATLRLPVWGTCPRSRGPVGNAYHTVSRPQVGPVVLAALRLPAWGPVGDD
jgi:hypothetical protein